VRIEEKFKRNRRTVEAGDLAILRLTHYLVDHPSLGEVNIGLEQSLNLMFLALCLTVVTDDICRYTGIP
jgi:hypothetical protein